MTPGRLRQLRSASPDGPRQICFAFNGARSNDASGQPASLMHLRHMNIYPPIAALFVCRVCGVFSSTETEAWSGRCVTLRRAAQSAPNAASAKPLKLASLQGVNHPRRISS